ncbi:S24 family peptidase [Psychromonas sp. MME2]|uniref:XRE family transcriptional regulator n=1 Tax=unclassified Psychromonas TaxID=2614957 RepID=UPI00339BDFBF
MTDKKELECTRSSKPGELECFQSRLNKIIGTNSARSLALKAGVSPTALRKYIDGESTPNLERLIAIANAGGVSVQWLATGEEVAERVEYLEAPTVGEPSDFDDFVLIPGYSVQVSAGFGSVGNDEKIPTRHLAFRKKWLQYKGFKPQDLIALWAKGDSMEPSIGDNNTLIVHTAENKPVDGNIYIFRLEDQLVVKRVQVNLFGSYLLISDNSHYPPMEIKKADMEQFDVIGKVVHIAKDV